MISQQCYDRCQEDDTENEADRCFRTTTQRRTKINVFPRTEYRVMQCREDDCVNQCEDLQPRFLVNRLYQKTVHQTYGCHEESNEAGVIALADAVVQI